MTSKDPIVTKYDPRTGSWYAWRDMKNTLIGVGRTEQAAVDNLTCQEWMQEDDE